MPEPESSGPWSIESAIVNELVKHAGMTPGRALKIIERKIQHLYFNNKNLLNRRLAESLNWPRYSDGTPIFRAAPINNKNMVIPAHLNNELIVPLVADALEADTNMVIELGCGYGRHLFALRDLVEHDYPQIRYFGCDFSEVGLETGRRLASMEPNRSSITFHKFDFLNPSFDYLPPVRKVLFFTCHAIEQVHEIEPTLIFAMRDTAEFVRAIHAEPVGWQLIPEITASARYGVLSGTKLKYELGGEIDNAWAASVPISLYWNKNLVSILKELSEKGAITLENVYLNACGNDMHNPSTLMSWRKRGS